MAGDEQLPTEAEALAPDDADELPLDEVMLHKRTTNGTPYWYWVADRYESLVGYRDPEVARLRGAEHLRRHRQLRAIRVEGLDRS